MSFQDWQRGVRAGMEQECLPALRERDREWHRACREIIDCCVAPDMYPAAMALLERAAKEAAKTTDAQDPQSAHLKSMIRQQNEALSKPMLPRY